MKKPPKIVYVAWCPQHGPQIVNLLKKEAEHSNCGDCMATTSDGSMKVDRYVFAPDQRKAKRFIGFVPRRAR